MKIDKTAEIPIHHRWQDYICCIGYSEYEEEFTLISSRYANPNKTETPNNEMDLYLRILREPALRANMLEALTPELKGQISDLREKAISERGNSIGLWAGFVAMGIAGYMLYRLTQLLAKYVGYDWAEMITYVPAFFCFFNNFSHSTHCATLACPQILYSARPPIQQFQKQRRRIYLVHPVRLWARSIRKCKQEPRGRGLTIRSSRPHVVASAGCTRYASTRPPPRHGAA